MFSKITRSFCNINHKLYLALLLMGFLPTIYTTLRVFFLGQLPGEYAYSIAGQLSWVNLLYEITNEAIILPLFYFMGKTKQDTDAFSNLIRSGLLISFVIYTLLSAAIMLFAEPLLAIMAADPNILAASATYIRIESIANLFAVLAQFVLVALVTIGKKIYLYIFTGARLLLCLISDAFLVSCLPFSANLGVNGIGYSNILVNAILLAVSAVLLSKEKIQIISTKPLCFQWMHEFLQVGGISGLESLVRNVAYMVMVARMVNVVNEQGTYWVANQFIWGWLLLPVLQLGELIKQEVSSGKDLIRKHSLGYFGITAIIVLLWFVSIPVWKPFMAYVLDFSDVDKLYALVALLIVFYIPFAFQNIFDATFYGLGKTKYMLFESVTTNLIYYGIVFVLYQTGVWMPTLTGIALLFGFGNLFDSFVSFLAYKVMLKKEKLNILDIS